MARIMIKCPETGKPLFAGMYVPKELFEVASFTNNTMKDCPHCGQDHTWEKKDAWIEEDEK
jgi:hypothetical protein